jgi:hypothetical protein
MIARIYDNYPVSTQADLIAASIYSAPTSK